MGVWQTVRDLVARLANQGETPFEFGREILLDPRVGLAAEVALAALGVVGNRRRRKLDLLALLPPLEKLSREAQHLLVAVALEGAFNDLIERWIIGFAPVFERVPGGPPHLYVVVFPHPVQRRPHFLDAFAHMAGAEQRSRLQTICGIFALRQLQQRSDLLASDALFALAEGRPLVFV